MKSSTKLYCLALCLVSALLLANCGGTTTPLTAENADYKASSLYEENRLVRPPNVLSDIEQVLLQTEQGGVTRLLPEITQARIKREETLRWLEIDLPPIDVWVAVREFWLDQGFALEIELPEAGIIETDWQQDRALVLGTGLSRYLDIAFERINDTGIRHRYRTLIEPGADANSTNIYIAFRGIKQEQNGEFVPLEVDRTREAEMLRRLLLSFRLAEESVATLEEFEQQVTVNNLYETNAHILVILRDREQAWRRLQLALDRGGFTVVQSDLDEGRIVLLLAEPNKDPDNVGLFDRFFGSDDVNKPPYEVVLQVQSSNPDSTRIIAPEGAEGTFIIDRIANFL